jgi:DNA polymerase-3 subunit alpha
MDDFVHLHVHTQYSMLDGAIRLKPETSKIPEERMDLVSLVQRMDMKAVAITDHANMFGVIGFYKACLAAGIQPIIGCEVNVARDTGARGRAAESAPVDHLTLLAASDKGYHNIVRICSLGHIEPASDVGPSVTLDTVASNASGVVMLTGCLGGRVPQTILHQGPDAAEGAIAQLRDIADPGHLFVELQDHGLPEQPVLNQILVSAARNLNLPMVATNDVHYARREDAEAQLLLNCIYSGTTYDEAKMLHHGSSEMYLKSPREMAERFSSWPEALTNTLRVAEMCSSWKLKLGEPTLPSFELPEGQDTTTYFIKVAMDGLQDRFDEYRRGGKAVDESMYRKRLEREISVIVEMKFPGYFLIVWDFIRFAKENGIPVGPGRGSGAGSLVAYAMRITDLDPMPYDLLFERFLNPERVSMPDFDIDFCMDRRDEVIRYVARKYGVNSVGQIATFHELKARSVIKDVSRSMGVPAQEAQRLASLVPEVGPGKTATISEALGMEPKLRAILEMGGAEAEVLVQAQKLEGLTRHVGMHAAGVVIADGPLWDTVPAFKHGDTLVTQYYMSDVEQAGLVKFDFLGLRTLTVIDIAVRRVNMRPDRKGKEPFDINAIPMDDAETFSLLQSGDTIGVFQLESSGMQNLFKKLRPDCFEDIIAAVALYRPGPLESGMVDQFVACKHGRQQIKKMHPLIDGLLKPTYGVIVYQEQVMQIAQKLASYSLGGADLLRRAMGKKKKEEMDKQTDAFLQGARANGVDEDKAREIFELVAQFAKYGFNRSHSAGYALVTYQSAYLKAHYPAEFLCALMTADREKTEKVVRIIDEGRAMGVEILAPDINGSDTDFKVVYGAPEGGWKPPKGSRLKDALHPKIRFGLGAVRGVGDAALEAVFEAREQGPFKDLFDFCSRVDARKLNRGVLEALVQCGAFDETLGEAAVTRSQAFAAIDLSLERGRSASKDRERGQTTLFGLFDAAAGSATSTVADYPEVPSWDLREVCVREKQALGFYVSGHPLDRYGKDFERFGVDLVASLPAKDQWAEVRVAGMVEGYREKIFKGAGGKSAFFDLEDKTGKLTVKVRENRIEKAAPLLTSGEPVVVGGKLRFPEAIQDAEEGDVGPQLPTLMLDSVELLSDVVRSETRSVALCLDAASTTEPMIRGLASVLKQAPGTCGVSIVLSMGGGAEVHLVLPSELSVAPDDQLFTILERHFGRQVAELR